ncbi:MAG: hypothetical protein HPY44_01955 [Armatimonadetes bacterium]|nr:hypothetical protein [Armatimonadota bacterium]
MYRIGWLISVALLSLVVCAAPAPEDGPRLLEDIELLRQIAPLKLTVPQIDQVLAMYAKLGIAETEASFNEQTLRELTEIKARLLRGGEMTREDTVVLNGVLKLTGAGRMRARFLPQIEAALREILTPSQMLLLRQPQIAERAADRPQEQVARANLKILAAAVAAAAEDWPAVRDAAIAGLVLNIADAAEKQAAQQALPAFLDRLRELGPEGISREIEELAGDLQALMPSGMSLLTADALVVARGGKAQDRASLRAVAIFASPELPRILQEMKAAMEQ